jgi:hypothetical protein
MTLYSLIKYQSRLKENGQHFLKRNLVCLLYRCENWALLEQHERRTNSGDEILGVVWGHTPVPILCGHKAHGMRKQLSVYSLSEINLIIGKWSTWRTILYHYVFLFLTLYMFRAHRAHHQERQIVSVQPLVTVTLYRWPCRVQVGSEVLNTKIHTW